MKKLICITMLLGITVSAFSAPRGRGARKSSRMIDALERIEREKETNGYRSSLESELRTTLREKTSRMGVELEQFQDFVDRNRSNEEHLDALRDLYEMTVDSTVEYTKRQLVEELLGTKINLDILSETKLKIDTPQLLEAVREWSEAELVELNKLLNEVIEKSLSEYGSPGEALVNVIDPIFKDQVRRKCM